MKPVLNRWMAGLVLAFCCSRVAAAPLTLVADGKPNAVIVAAAADPQAAQAAAEIQKYVEKMSGAKLPLVVEPAADTSGLTVKIAVGHTGAAAKLKVPAGFDAAIRPNAFDEEGYLLKTSGSTLVVAGNSDGPYHGTLYGAYALLERLGCRWYFPGEWGEVVPQRTTVAVPDLDITSHPDFAVRGIWLSCWNPESDRKEYGEWCMKVGLLDKDLYPTAGDGFLAQLLPAKENAEAHPEYYAMDKQGKRTATAKSPDYATMLCLSNPDVLAGSIANLKAAFAGTRKMGCVTPNGVGISPPDGTPFCYCDKCKAAGQNFNYPNYEAERMMSEEYCGFAAKLATAFPDKYVALSAYALREVPPQGVKLPPNMSVAVWPITSCVLHADNDTACWRRQETMKIVQGWRDLTPHVVMCGYTPGLLSVYGPAGAYVPEGDVGQFAVEAPLLKKMGIKGSYDQGAPAFMATWLSSYVRAKLLWNAKSDVTALKREFYDTFFGAEAGSHVQAWWDACEAALSKSTCHAHEDWLLNHIYTVAFTQGIHEHVAAAQNAKLSAAQRAHLDAFALIADNLEAYAAMNDAEAKLDYAGAAKAAERMAGARVKLLKIDSFFVIGNPDGEGKALPPDGLGKDLKRLAALTDGSGGTLVASIPAEARFSRDRFNEGVLGEWYRPAFDDSQWGNKNTFYTWDQQDKPEDAAGHDYDGYGWYRMTINVPADAVNKTLKLRLGGVVNEGWVWINGQYAGHRPWNLWWMGRDALEMEVDATGKIKPGANQITVRVWNNAEIGGMLRRGFLYAPKAPPAV